jgi:hypothetical protein
MVAMTRAPRIEINDVGKSVSKSGCWLDWYSSIPPLKSIGEICVEARSVLRTKKLRLSGWSSHRRRSAKVNTLGGLVVAHPRTKNKCMSTNQVSQVYIGIHDESGLACMHA